MHSLKEQELFMVQNETITIELVYIEPESQNVIELNIDKGSNIEQAIHHSGLLTRFPEIDLSINKVGVFNKIKNLDTTLTEGDRIEIYRPLLADPKEARRQRAKKK